MMKSQKPIVVFNWDFQQIEGYRQNIAIHSYDIYIAKVIWAL